MNKLVIYNSQEGYQVNKCLQNKDVTKIVESYLFNDAYIRVSLPWNVSQKTKIHMNLNLVLDHEEFVAFYGFHREKEEIQDTSGQRTLTVEFVQRFINSIQKEEPSQQEPLRQEQHEEYMVLDYYVDYRFNQVLLNVLYTKPYTNNCTQKLEIQQYDISSDYTACSDNSSSNSWLSSIYSKLSCTVVHSLRNIIIGTTIGIIIVKGISNRSSNTM